MVKNSGTQELTRGLLGSKDRVGKRIICLLVLSLILTVLGGNIKSIFIRPCVFVLS